MNEREFGKVQNMLETYGFIADVDDRLKFHEILSRMLKEAMEYDAGYAESNGVTTECELAYIKDGVAFKEEERMIISEKIDVLVDILDEGDYDDAFGSSGWRDIIGW